MARDYTLVGDVFTTTLRRNVVGERQYELVLRPCPHCGSLELQLDRPVTERGTVDETNWYAVRCTQCHAVGPLAREIEDAGYAWNVRVRRV
jgi:Lar family restriction alleviation protein